MAEYVLFNNTPALVTVEDDGKKYIRLGCFQRVRSADEIAEKWRRLRAFTNMTLDDFTISFRHEYVSSLLPLESFVDSGVVTAMPAGYWQRNIPSKWWALCRKSGGAK